MRIIGCPECEAPAEVVDEGAVPSTAGAVHVVRIRCVNRHWFLMLDDALPPEPSAAPTPSPPASTDRQARS